jgi:hypothetical protein
MSARYKSNHRYFELYFKYYSVFQLGSVFLNAGNNIAIGVDAKFYDEQNLKNELVHYTGRNQTGLFKKDGQDVLALIPSAKAELSALEENFKRHQINKKNQGFEVTEYDSKVLDRKLYWEALIDTMEMEVIFIEKKLATFVDKVEEVDNSKVLCYGLQGSIKQEGGKVKMIDFQKVSMIDDINCIDDPRSPYDGLSLLDYRKLCSVFYQEQKRKAKGKLLQAQAECRERGIPVVSHIGATTFKRVNKSNLPPFPADCVNHKRKKPEEDSTSKALTRTK